MLGQLDWGSLGSVATAIAVFVAAWQVRQGTLQARVDFEDDLSREYRALARCLPVKALLGQELSPEEFDGAFPTLYHYVDLSNEQVFLRMHGRIGKGTWLDWRAGIASNLRRPAFAEAWSRISESSDSFAELRRLAKREFADDPRGWIPVWKRLR